MSSTIQDGDIPAPADVAAPPADALTTESGLAYTQWEDDEVVLVAMPCAHIGGTGLGVMALASGDAWLDKGATVLIFGPPGVGKTSLGQSIARAVGLKFQRTSLGGNKHTRCVVPQAEPDLEVSVELASGDGTQVESRGSHSTNVSDLGNDRGEHLALTASSFVIGSEPCANKRLRQRRGIST